MERNSLKEMIISFIQLCDNLLSKGKITKEEYEEMTWLKKDFLEKEMCKTKCN